MAAPLTDAWTPLTKMLAVRDTAGADKCLSLMIQSNIRHLPVLTDAGGLAGVLSLRDMLAPLVPAVPTDAHERRERNARGTLETGGPKSFFRKIFS